MNYAIIIDSVAAVPSYFVKKRPFFVMPVSVELDGKVMPDTHRSRELVEFYTSGKINAKSEIKSSPPSIEQISELINDSIAPNYDYALCQTISNKVSPTFDNFQLAANGIARSARDIRNELGLEHSFHMNCISTGSTIAGSGLIAIYADLILSRGISFNRYIQTIQKLRHVVHNYGVVTDVMYSRARALDKGIKTISLPAAVFGKSVGLNPIVRISYDHETKPVLMKRGIESGINSLLKYATKRVREGLYAPIINLSYAGDRVDVENLPAYQRLLSSARKRNVTVLLGVMGLSAGVIFGPRALTMGIAPKNQTSVPK